MRTTFALLVISAFLVAFTGIPALPVCEESQVSRHELLAEADFAYEAEYPGKEMLWAQATSNMCQTPSAICRVPQYGPIGATCWCIGPSGPIQGVLIPMR